MYTIDKYCPQISKPRFILYIFWFYLIVFEFVDHLESWTELMKKLLNDTRIIIIYS
jgi:hypothetical protein